MLVLTRRPKEKIVFPTIRTEVQILGMHGGQVRLGIEAPPQVSVLRDELRDAAKSWESGEIEPVGGPGGAASRREFHHHIRNRLNDIGLTLGVLRCHLEKGKTDVAEESLKKVEEDFRILNEELEIGFSEAGLERSEEVEHPVAAHSK